MLSRVNSTANPSEEINQWRLTFPPFLFPIPSSGDEWTNELHHHHHHKRVQQTSSSAEGQWKHDKFENLDKIQVQVPSKKAAASPAGNRGGHAKLIVSNLRDTISSDSLRTLFGQAGKVVSVMLKVDQSGRSLGSAEVIMASVDAAKDAVSAFNNVKVDDQPIRVTLLKSWPQQQQQSAATTEAPARSTGATVAARTVIRTRSGSSANGRGEYVIGEVIAL